MIDYVYLVHGYYDMDIMEDEEILLEIYAKEEDAQKRCRTLIDGYKKNNEREISDDKGKFGFAWHETEYSLYAYTDSSWNVDIYYTKEKVL